MYTVESKILLHPTLIRLSSIFMHLNDAKIIRDNTELPLGYLEQITRVFNK